MSTNLIIGLIAAIAVVGGGAYVATNPEIMASLSGGSATTTEEVVVENESASVGSTFAELVALGQNVQCNFSYDDNAGNVSSGMLYMKAGGSEFRSDITVESPVAMEAHMVRTGGYNYMWSDSMPQAVKIQVTNEAEFVPENQAGVVDENTEFGCQAWNVDETVFDLPTAVEFVDMSAQINAGASVNAPGTDVSGSATGSASVKAQQCAACNMLSGSAKDQCLAALAC